MVLDYCVHDASRLLVASKACMMSCVMCCVSSVRAEGYSGLGCYHEHPVILRSCRPSKQSVVYVHFLPTHSPVYFVCAHFLNLSRHVSRSNSWWSSSAFVRFRFWRAAPRKRKTKHVVVRIAFFCELVVRCTPYILLASCEGGGL